MKRLLVLWILTISAGATVPALRAAEILRWDTLRKTVAVKSAQTNAVVSFWVTNISARPVNIVSIRPSCGCTMAKNTRLPKQLEPGAATPVRLDTDVNGKRGILNKSARVFSSAGIHVLTFKIAIGLEQQAMSRQRNLVLAEADPQAVFRNDCAKCHAEPTKGKTGKALFAAACGICHEAEHRASMVPDLNGQRLSRKQ